MLKANSLYELQSIMDISKPGEIIQVPWEVMEKLINSPTYVQNFEQRWGKIKEKGEQHHKTGGVEPIDLFLDGGMLRDGAITSIIRYAFRNRKELNRPINPKDIKKIIHYAEMLVYLEEKERTK